MGTTGTPLNLTWPAEGTEGWDTNYVNVNWGLINTWAAATNAAIAAAVKGDKGDTGPAGLVWAGPWNSGVSYVATNAVYFNGASYFCLSPNVNAEPDTHPSSWALLSAQGAQGIQGIQGPPGSGAGVTFPITLVQGGLGVDASTVPGKATARASLAAAASGVNADITELTGIAGVVLNSDSLVMTDAVLGGHSMSLSASTLTIESINIPPGPGPNTGELLIGATGGGVIGLQAPVSVGEGLTLTGGCFVDQLVVASQPTDPVAVGAGELSIGSRTSPTATAGGGQAAPGTVLGYLQINVSGAAAKIPYYAP